ncbi:hypothetical protein BD289DRAFT_113095 [Coniella lustricola]|uniref:Uncharacterized protein n=1 Tax=Coniella lustricola TaxID=2025994 RepID=A0A2T3AGD1_9PEZI|nr:hypothetical protein BD289DRAFT_113095 [Coniella lustricola]
MGILADCLHLLNNRQRDQRSIPPYASLRLQKHHPSEKRILRHDRALRRGDPSLCPLALRRTRTTSMSSTLHNSHCHTAFQRVGLARDRAGALFPRCCLAPNERNSGKVVGGRALAIEIHVATPQTQSNDASPASRLSQHAGLLASEPRIEGWPRP